MANTRLTVLSSLPHFKTRINTLKVWKLAPHHKIGEISLLPNDHGDISNHPWYSQHSTFSCPVFPVRSMFLERIFIPLKASHTECSLFLYHALPFSFPKYSPLMVGPVCLQLIHRRWNLPKGLQAQRVWWSLCSWLWSRLAWLHITLSRKGASTFPGRTILRTRSISTADQALEPAIPKISWATLNRTNMLSSSVKTWERCNLGFPNIVPEGFRSFISVQLLP